MMYPRKYTGYTITLAKAYHFAFSYSGKSNYGLTLKWRQLMSQSAEGAETILNLIWTDLVGFTIAGSRTGFENIGQMSTLFNDDSTPGLGVRRVHKYERSIHYADLRYAIPAFIVSGVFVSALIVSLLLCCFQRHMWRALNHYMNQTSMGRAVTQSMLRGTPNEISVHASTKDWSREARTIMLQVLPPLGTKSNLGSRFASKDYSETSQMSDTSYTLIRRVSDKPGQRHPLAYAAIPSGTIPNERLSL
jgi:hypothetical protein